MNTGWTHLSIHHVGGREGTREFPVMEAFEQDIESVLYDADESCVDSISQATRHLKSRTVVLPWLIGGASGEVDFFITANRYASSLFKILPHKSAFYNYDLKFAWDNDPESYQVDETIRLQMTTLDAIYDGASREAMPPDFMPPDFLSIDAEGAELDILKGASDLLTRQVIAVKVEVAFVTFREKSILAHEVQAYLEEKGFTLIELTPFRAEGKYHEPLSIGLRGDEISGFGDALFFKSPERIVSGCSNPAPDLIKGAFMALSFSKFELAQSYLKRLKQNDSRILAYAPDDPAYVRFVKEFATVSESYPAIFPIRFSMIFGTLESRKRRFQRSPDQPDKGRLRQTYFREMDWNEFKKNLPFLFQAPFIGVESVCLKYGLNAQAALLREKRHQQIIGLLNRLGFLGKDDRGNYVIDHQAISRYEQSM